MNLQKENEFGDVRALSSKEKIGLCFGISYTLRMDSFLQSIIPLFDRSWFFSSILHSSIEHLFGRTSCEFVLLS
jgi:hypothetical protein